MCVPNISEYAYISIYICRITFYIISLNSVKATSVFARSSPEKDERASFGFRGIMVPSFEFKTKENRTRYS